MGTGSKNELAATDLDVGVAGRDLVCGMNLAIRAGEILAILGPNGVGKSLTLHTLAGLRPPDNGAISLGGSPLNTLDRQQIATCVALLPQYTEDIFPATVLDTVMIGRHPHIGRFQWESGSDREIARAALQQLDLLELQNRNVGTLSGGERRRLAIAQVLTQNPSTYLLDEPTNHLDPHHQLDVLHLFRQRAAAGAAVAVSLHDVNLAARFADRCLLLYGDGRWNVGETAEVLSTQSLTNLYHAQMESVTWRGMPLYVATSGTAPEQSA